MFLKKNIKNKIKFLFKKLFLYEKVYEFSEKLTKKIRNFLKLLFCKSCSCKNNSIIASLTTYPPRINSCWITITSLFNQNFKNFKIVLVLSIDEFPTKKIPWTLKFLQTKGLEILWCKENYKSYKKLIPVKKKYPNSIIITFDDDLIYEKWRINQLILEHKIFPQSIIGHRGREIKINKDNKVESYLNWKLCTKRVNSKYVFLTGGAGALYPPNKLFDKLVKNYALANKLCPNGDDIFFWAIAYYSNINIICLGNEKIENVFELRNTPKLWDSNSNTSLKVNNDTQIRSVIKYFRINL